MADLKNRTLVIIGGGLLQLPVIRTANSMGIHTVVVDMNREAPGVKEAGSFIHSSTMDADGTLYNVEKFHSEVRRIEACLTVGTDASYTVSVIAKKLGLCGNEPEAALQASDKFLMRRALRKAKVPVPDFDMVDTFPRAQETFERLGGDCVMKPLRNMGARGVRRVNSQEDLKPAFDLAVQYSQTGKVIIEQYIDAAELSIDALVYNGQVHLTGIADRIIEYDPYFVETGHIMPTSLPEDIVHNGVDAFLDGIKALGITHGAAKGDIKVSQSGAFVGEIAARLSGGFMSTHTYPYSSGVDLMKAMINVAFGIEPPASDLTPVKQWVSIERSLIAPPGIIKSVDGLDDARRMPFVNDLFFDAKPGDKVRAPLNNIDKQGHIIVTAPTYREALSASNAAVRTIRVRSQEDDDQLISDDELRNTAKTRFNGKCLVCPDCDGRRCRGWLPGVGGIGTGMGFVNAVERLRRIDIIPSYINNAKVVDTRTTLFGHPLDHPIIPGPITGSITNLGGALTELELARAIVKGANHAGTIGFVGDGATPSKYRIGIRVVLENFGMAIPVFKPRYDQKLILERIEAAKTAGALAVAMDIDAASFLTMEMKGQSTSTKTMEEIRELVKAAGIPFLLKGILSPGDAVKAMEAGVSGIIVSNHGGRVNDSLVAPIDVLPAVRKAVGKDMLVIFDGGVRNGGDAFKALGLGADLVMVGRPVMIAAAGGGIQGVRQCLNRMAGELKRTMTFAGAADLAGVKSGGDFFFMR